MFYSERQEQLLALLKKEKSMRVSSIASKLFTSESTVRRDLTALESEGLVRRTFGGAVICETERADEPLVIRNTKNTKAKSEIAKRAAELVHDGMVIFLDSSSTAAHLVPYLTRFHDLTVITNSPATSIALGECGIRNFCTGGELSSRSVSFVGGYAQDFIRGFNADIAFISCRGLSEDGLLTESNVEFVHIKKQMMKNAKRKVFLCDRSKIDRSYPHRLATKDEFDDVIIE
jgi:DeoR/GlpR family transcriptional regulator of sugar metabolism